MDTSTIIRHYRGKTSLRTFAERIGVSHAAVQQWESGATEPSDERIAEFSNSDNPLIREMGKRLFIARHGETLRSFIK